MQFTKAFLTCVAVGACSAALAGTPDAPDMAGLLPHYAAYLRSHPDAAARLAQLRAGHLAGKTRPPAIISGKIATETVDALTAPAVPVIMIKYAAPAFFREALFFFTTPNGLSYATGGSPDVVGRTGTLRLQNEGTPIGLYAVPGSWTMTEAEITDNAGNVTSYTATQLAALFPSLSFTVTNAGAPDGTPPSFTSGTILTPTVSLKSKPAFFAANLAVTDDLSGVASVSLIVEAPNGDQFTLGGPLPMPVRTGTPAGYLQFLAGYSTQQTGTWHIVGITVSDAANNSVVTTSDADILAAFGTDSFTVTE